MLRMILSLTLAATAARAQPGDVQPLRRVVALLDYVGGDYARAVGEHGEVLSQAEHSEQIGFVEDAARELRADVNGSGEDLAKRLDALRQRVAERAPPAEVAQSARSEEHTSNSSHGSISYAVFCLKKKKSAHHQKHKR